jgi:two-component system chemotaxis sensor kinase CheA
MSQSLSEDAEIKQLFVDESLEALQRVEQMLLDAEEGKGRADLVDVMFRDMHTIKGTAGLLGYEKTTALAHAAEDLMSRLRDKTMQPRAEHFALMVEVIDCLRTYVESTRDTDGEGSLNSAGAIAQLRKYYELGDEVQAVPAPAPTAPSPPPPPEPEPVQAQPPPAPAPMEAAPSFMPTPAPQPRETAPLPPPTAPTHEARAEAEPSTSKHTESDGTVRVSVGVLDKLMNLMGELVLSRNQMVQLMRTQRDTASQAAAQRLSIVTSDLQEQIMKTRMQPVARVFEKIPRQVRDLAQQTGKRVTVELEGTTTELDKALVEAIRDPVMHIIRNAIDHGIETPADRTAKGKSPTGKLIVRAAHEGSTVSIEVRDDGKGIDPTIVKRVAVSRGVITQAEADRMGDREATELIFRPGFSTAEKVTSISGRGVGMDVVRTHVERAGGQVELQSELGRGTSIVMKMPLTLAIIPALLVRDGAQRFAIPQANLLELVHLDEEQVKTQIEYVRGAPIYRLRGEILPIVRLAPLLRRSSPEGAPLNLVVVAIGLRRYGLAVESILDTEEIVIKPLHSMLKKLTCYAGATVLGDGGVALILDVGGVAAMAGIDLNSRQEQERKAVDTAVGSKQSMLVFQAGEYTRCAVPVSMVARLEQVETKAIEIVAGNEVLQYRGEIMPIIRPESVMPIGMATNDSGVQQLLVFNFGRPVGLAVSAILDAIDVGAVHTSDVPHTLGRTVIGGKTTLLMDVFSLVRQVAPNCLVEPGSKPRKPRVLLSDELDAMRASLAGFLRASGVEVVEVTADAALKELRQHQRGYDAVVTGLDPVARGLELVRTLKAEQPDLPVVCVSREDLRAQAESVGARACVRRVEREALLEALSGAGIFEQHRAEVA